MTAVGQKGGFDELQRETIGASVSDSDDDNSEESEEQLPDLPHPWDSDDDLNLDHIKPGLEWWQVSLSTVVVVIGIGIMALPRLPQLGGMYVTLLVMILCYVTSIEAGMAMWKGFMAANDKNKGGVISYEDFGRAAYQGLGEGVVLCTIGFYFAGACAGYVDLIVAAFEKLFAGTLSNFVWKLVLLPVFIALALLPNLTAVAKLVPLAVAAICALCCIIVTKSALDSQHWATWPEEAQNRLHREWPESASDVGVVLATVLGAFGVVGNVPSLLSEMKEPMHFPFAFKLAMTVVLGLYLLVSLVGYYAYGEFMREDIILAMTSFPRNEIEAFSVPFNQWTGPKSSALQKVASALILTKLLVGFPFLVMVIVNSLQTFKYTRTFVPAKSLANKVMRVIIVLLVLTVSIAVPNFNELFALCCAVSSPLISVIFPLVMGYKIRRDRGARKSSWQRRFLHLLMVVLALFTLLVGTEASLREIFKG